MACSPPAKLPPKIAVRLAVESAGSIVDVAAAAKANRPLDCAATAATAVAPAPTVMAAAERPPRGRRRHGRTPTPSEPPKALAPPLPWHHALLAPPSPHDAPPSRCRGGGIVVIVVVAAAAVADEGLADHAACAHAVLEALKPVARTAHESTSPNRKRPILIAQQGEGRVGHPLL